MGPSSVGRASVVSLLLAVLAAAGCGRPAPKPPSPSPATTFVVIHGAWGGGWAWAAVDSMLTSAGHRATRPTLTGLGERVHLARPETGLDTHVTDVVNHLVFEELQDVVLVGHSYGGMVAMGVAHRVPDRVRRIVLVDAFLPEDGESVIDAVRGTPLEWWIVDLVEGAEGGMITPSWIGPPEEWPGDVPHPVATFTEPVSLGNAAADPLPGTYILTAERATDPATDFFAAFADRARARGWQVRVLRSDHNPQSSAREELVELLLEDPNAR